MKKKIQIKYTIDRVVLSDVLPYETPLIFSNRYYYKYLIKREKSIKNSTFKEKNNKAFAEIESLLFSPKDNITKPFGFNIRHKENDFRELKIIHPCNQESVVNFYEKYKDIILFYCSLSPFSIRKPAKVAKFSFYNDILHKRDKEGSLAHSQIEQDENEYENLKSYFTYQKYSNVFKFYESYQFHRSEKKYNKLVKADISRCFDSIYTHTIAWALYNKSIIKENLDEARSTFAGEFDTLMQRLNYNETNGIVIGPEFSRVFSEILLQQVDLTIFENLKKPDEDGIQLIYKVDYEIFRYVDDYFIFCNEDKDVLRIQQEIKLALKEYNLYVNASKTVIYEKPIITEISLAKQKICDLFDKHSELTPIEKDDILIRKSKIYINSNNTITRYKAIIKETNVGFKDVMNYSLAVLDKKTAKIINYYKKEQQFTDSKLERKYEKAFLEILDVAFFLYSISPRVNSTIKLCLIINKIQCFIKSNKTNEFKEPFCQNTKHNILKKISDEIFLILQKNRSQKNVQIETLYLLIASGQLGREYRLNHRTLCSYFNIKENIKGELEFQNELNYFSTMVLLFYIKDIEEYKPIKEALKIHILKKFYEAKLSKSWKVETETILLLMDILTCPYLNDSVSSHIKDKYLNAKKTKSKHLNEYIKKLKDAKYKFKKDVLSLLEIKENQIPLIEQERFWFIKWTEFDFGMELQAKRSQEVY